MKILVIPDIHGRCFWRLHVNNIDKYDKVVFLGDYVDPYGPENITEEDKKIATRFVEANMNNLNTNYPEIYFYNDYKEINI